MIVAAAEDLLPWFNDTVATAGIVGFYLVVWGLVFAGTGLFVGDFPAFRFENFGDDAADERFVIDDNRVTGSIGHRLFSAFGLPPRAIR